MYCTRRIQSLYWKEGTLYQASLSMTNYFYQYVVAQNLLGLARDWFSYQVPNRIRAKTKEGQRGQHIDFVP